jgi:membrane-bound serine protease (ClpP class)
MARNGNAGWTRFTSGWRRFVLLLVVSAVLAAVFGLGAQAEERASRDGVPAVYVVPLEQTIERGLERFLTRAFKEAEQKRADYVVLRIDTLGGAVDAAVDIGTLVRNSPVTTVAFIEGRAISAGTYISLNADRIVMAPGSSIGSAAMVDLAGNRVTDSKTLAYWLAEMRAAARLNDRNELYAAGMVDDSLTVEVPEIGKTFGPGELIAFNYEEALRAGYADGIAKNLDEVIRFLGYERASVVEVQPTAAEKLARFLTHPAVSALLLLAGIGGVLMELFQPGFGIPGIIGIASFSLYFLGNYIAGFAGIEHIVLFVIGVILIVLEIFLPTMGIFGIIGGLCLFGSILLAAYDYKQALVSLGVAIVGAIVVLAVFLRYFGKKGGWSRLVLKDRLDKESGYVSQSAKDHLLGKTGIAHTVLRPAGIAMIDDAPVDVVTRGEYIMQGREIEVVQVEGPRVVVREIVRADNEHQ